MDRFFHPHSIVVIGVSASETNMARFIVYNCKKWGFPGAIYAVGPRGGSVYGVDIHPDLEQVPDGVEMAVILTPSRVVPDLLETCGKKGITRVVIESGGFSEFDDQAVGLEQQCLDIARRHGIRLVGPNGIGLVYPRHGIALPFTPFENPIPQGDVSILSQSGGVAIHLILEMVRQGQGLCKLVSLGNKLDLDEVDFVRYLLEDPETRIIVLYLEGLSRARELMELATRADKPIILLKSSVGTFGARAARSHTAALSQDDAVVEAAMKQAGILRVGETAELVLAAKALRMPPMKGNRVAVVSRSGGHAILVADALERDGFSLPTFHPSVLEVARKALRANVIQLNNPLDVGDIFDFPAYLSILESILEAGDHDGILFLHTYRVEPQRQVARQIMQGIEELAARHDKPISCCLVTLAEELRALRSISAYPLFEMPEEAAHALRLSRNHCQRTRHPFTARLATEPVPSIPFPTDIQAALKSSGWLPLPDATRILEHIGIPVPRWGLATHPQQAIDLSNNIGEPVVLKALSSRLLHKSDADAVSLDLKGAQAVGDGYRQLVERVTRWLAGHLLLSMVSTEQDKPIELDGVLVQQQAKEGLEVIVGGRRDETFGPIVLFGMGGILAELLQDVSIRVAPADRAVVREMISQTRAARLLDGYRGQPVRDREALEEILLAISRLLTQHPEIQEIDCNPVRLYPMGQGALALDVRIRVGGDDP
ncbi:MAG: acetate--CoA ligase family protein [Bradymonadales bacterium]|nr:acetate--CoA ligase family protein [Bradymonadales bacterium]